MAFKKVSEIEKALADRAYAEAILSKVDKGNKGAFSYVPWNESVALLTTIFGVFGWSAKIVGSHSDTERGVYRTDLVLTVRAIDDETGVLVEKSVPGTGGSQAGPLSHEDSMKASRSDALSVACKSLGDAFGLFLYDKGDPARGGTAPAPRPDTQERKPAASNSGVGYASEKQLPILRKHGWSDEAIRALDKIQLRAVMDGLFGKGEVIPPPAHAAVDDFPF